MAKQKTQKNETTPQTESLVKREYTEEEKASIARYQELSKSKPVKFKEVKGKAGKITINCEYPDGLLYPAKMSEAFGTTNPELCKYLLAQVTGTFEGTFSSDGRDNEMVVTAINATMALLNGIQPKDEIEGMLVVQMIGVHNVATAAMRRGMLKDQTFAGRQANIDNATKMLRTFVAQMEALKKYRTGGQQKMIVEHVSVNEGGQAIVGTVNQGGGKNGQSVK
jgi:hypothetical protein